MSLTETVLLVVFCVLFAASSVPEKVFRHRLFKNGAGACGGNFAAYGKASALRVLFSLLQLLFGGLVLALLIVAGAPHGVLLLAAAAMLFTVLV